MRITIPGASEIAVGARHTCAATYASVYCWGDDAAKQIADGTNGDVLKPTPLVWDDPSAGKPGTRHLALGDAHTCVLLDGGPLRCRGSIELRANLDAVEIASGARHACARGFAQKRQPAQRMRCIATHAPSIALNAGIRHARQRVHA